MPSHALDPALLELKKMNTYLSLLTDEQVNDYDTIKG